MYHFFKRIFIFTFFICFCCCINKSTVHAGGSSSGSVTFNPNGGTWTADNNTTNKQIDIHCDGNITTATTVTFDEIGTVKRNGYSFAGWYYLDTTVNPAQNKKANIGNSGFCDFGTLTPNGITLTAKWNKLEENGDTDSVTSNEHEHAYEWMIVKEPTCMEDGLEVNQCIICGDIIEEHVLNAYGFFNKDTINKINTAKKNTSITVETDRWISFSSAVIEALIKRPDLELIIKFKYNGESLYITIPAGKITDEKVPYYGFLHLAELYGLQKEP